ncbi:MAG: acyl carrier protein [Jatrophihabitantaceae bacterium]
MPDHPALERADVLAMLAQLGTRGGDSVLERLSSMEVAWLVHQVEQRYDIELDLDDEQLGQLRTISDAVHLLGESVRASHG